MQMLKKGKTGRSTPFERLPERRERERERCSIFLPKATNQYIEITETNFQNIHE